MKDEHVKIEVRKVVRNKDDEPSPKWLKYLYFGALGFQIVIAIFTLVELFMQITGKA